MGLLLFGGCNNSHPASGASSVNELARGFVLYTVTLDAVKYVTLLHPNAVNYYERKWPGFFKAVLNGDMSRMSRNPADFRPENVGVEPAPRDDYTQKEWAEARAILGNTLPMDAYWFTYKEEGVGQLRLRVLVVQDDGRYYVTLPDFPEELKPPKSRK